MSDDNFDELLAQSIRDYNAPGAIPREEMWQRIQAARAARIGVFPLPAAPAKRRTFGAPVWIGAAAAAALVLSVGVVIGRRVERNRAPAVAAAQPTVQATNTESTTVAKGPEAPPVSDRDSIVAAIRHETQHTAQRARELASAAPAPRAAGNADETRALAYHLVVMQHLAGSEAMITAFRSAARRGAMDAQLASWSRDLLSTTRLLETSPAVIQDPTMRRLLEDLDLVISQIAQYTTRGQINSDDLDLIEQSIDKRGVMEKLRSLPVGNAPAGT